MSREIDLHIALEHGFMALAGVLRLSSSPCSEDNFRRVLGRVRRDADIAAHYARRYLESGGPVPERTFLEELEAILKGKMGPAEASAAGAKRRGRPSGSTHELAGGLSLVIQGLHKFRHWHAVSMHQREV